MSLKSLKRRIINLVRSRVRIKRPKQTMSQKRLLEIRVMKLRKMTTKKQRMKKSRKRVKNPLVQKKNRKPLKKTNK